MEVRQKIIFLRILSTDLYYIFLSVTNVIAKTPYEFNGLWSIEKDLRMLEAVKFTNLFRK